jgi:hypothetical protein
MRLTGRQRGKRLRAGAGWRDVEAVGRRGDDEGAGHRWMMRRPVAERISEDIASILSNSASGREIEAVSSLISLFSDEIRRNRKNKRRNFLYFAGNGGIGRDRRKIFAYHARGDELAYRTRGIISLIVRTAIISLIVREALISLIVREASSRLSCERR